MEADEEDDYAYSLQKGKELVKLWLPTKRQPRFGNFSYQDGDPELRTYSLGDEACEMAVRLAKENGIVATDIETDGLAEESFTVKVIIIGTATHAAVLDAFNPKHVAAAKEAFSAAQGLVFHNSPYDVPPLVFCGAMTLDMINKVTDTLILARMAFTDSIAGRGLADLERSVLGATGSNAAKDRFAQWCKINKFSKSEGFKRATYKDSAYTMYAGHDVIITARLLMPLLELALIQMTNHPFGRYGADRATAIKEIQKQQQVNRVKLRRTAKGLTFDAPKMQAEQDRIMEKQSELDQTLKLHGINSPSNRNELVAALVKADAFPSDYPVTEKTKQPKTGAKFLKRINHPAVKAFQSYDDHNRTLNYLETSRKIAERTDGRLHPTVNIMKAVTGRLSYSNPATHQFTPSAREMIMGDELGSGEYDRMVSVDWSAIEPILTANLAGDFDVVSVYEQGGDLYMAVAEAGGVTRKPAKVVLLGGMYGQQVKSLAAALSEALGRPVSMAEAAKVSRQVKSGAPMIFRLIGWATEWSRVTGKTWTVAGRIADVPPFAPYKGANFTVQGSSYDFLADTICEMDNQGMSDMLYLTQHDELIVSDRIAEETMMIMRKPSDRFIELSGRVPVLRVDRADIGSRWRTPPDDGCVCGGKTSLKWNGATWQCGEHAHAGPAAA